MTRDRFFSRAAYPPLTSAQDLRLVWRLARDAGAESRTLSLIRAHMRRRALSAVHLARTCTP